MRPDNRATDELRPVTIERDWVDSATASALISFGSTRVLCTASVEENVPRWMKGSGKGWVSAEYSMLPGSSNERINRERKGAKGRTQEIERLIARSLRAVVDLETMGEVQVMVDCDVLRADGGTRIASITGGYVALHDSFSRMVAKGVIGTRPITDACAAISVGVIDGEPRLDLPYVEDSIAEVDMNVVKTGDGNYIEVQGTAEGASFDRSVNDRLLDLADSGIATLVELQNEVLATPPAPR